jgi:hypothetical protein
MLYGIMLKPIRSMGYLIKGHIPGAEIRFSKHASGKKIWEQLYRYPETGTGFKYTNLMNPKILGNAFAIYEFINVPVFKKDKLFLYYNLSLGMAYLTKKFDIESNYYNIAISSNFNIYLGISLFLKTDLSRRLSLITSLDYIHFSNGSISQPNLGINAINIRLGAAYKFGNQNPDIISSIPEFVRNNKLIINYSCGYKAILPPQNKQYFISSLSINLQRLLTYKSGVGTGMDLFYDNSFSDRFKRKNIEYSDIDLFRSGFYISHELYIGKTSIVTHFGIYTYQKYFGDGDFYSRMGIRYRFSEHFSANIFLKTHFASADFIEWGIGYHF